MNPFRTPSWWTAFAIALVVHLGLRVIRRWATLHLAWKNQLAGNPRRSRACLRQHRRLFRATRSSWLCEGSALLWDGEFERAIALVDARLLPAKASRAVVPLLIRLEALLFLGRVDEAKRSLAEHATLLRASRERAADVVAIEGFLAFHEGEIELAAERLQRALGMAVPTDPIVSGIVYFLAAIAYRRGEHDDAERLLAQTIRRSGRRFTTVWAETEHAERFPELAVPERAPMAIGRDHGKPLSALLRDLSLGVGVAFFRFTEIRVRPFTRARVTALVLFDLAFAISLHAGELGFGHLPYGAGMLANVAAVLVLLPVLEIALHRVPDHRGRLDVLGGLYAALPLWLIAWFTVVQTFGEHGVGSTVGEVVLAVWGCAVAYALCSTVLVRKASWRWMLCALMLFASWPVSMHVAARTVAFMPVVFRPESKGEDTNENESARNEQRNRAAFNQLDLLREAEDGLAAERPGRVDLYFVGGAGWGDQDVFVREVRATRTLFDERFDTAGRSLVLGNDPRSGALPVLTNVTLWHALNAVGKRMSHDEDVLFLFLTSHGSRRGLAFEFGADSVWGDEVLRPADLRVMLDGAGIKWRVLVISGCESGAYIQPLRSDDTLIVTAASDDRPSYGCAEGRAYTKFGRALFADELTRNRSFISAFTNVATTLDQRADDEGDVVPSYPQLAVGTTIATKLQELEAQLPPRSTSPF